MWCRGDVGQAVEHDDQVRGQLDTDEEDRDADRLLRSRAGTPREQGQQQQGDQHGVTAQDSGRRGFPQLRWPLTSISVQRTTASTASLICAGLVLHVGHGLNVGRDRARAFLVRRFEEVAAESGGGPADFRRCLDLESGAGPASSVEKVLRRPRPGPGFGLRRCGDRLASATGPVPRFRADAGATWWSAGCRRRPGRLARGRLARGIVGSKS